MNWYDYGARTYDPAIGRWHTIDPMAEKYISLSPYHTSGNNPVNFVDVNGMEYFGMSALVVGNAKNYGQRPELLNLFYVPNKQRLFFVFNI